MKICPPNRPNSKRRLEKVPAEAHEGEKRRHAGQRESGPLGGDEEAHKYPSRSASTRQESLADAGSPRAPPRPIRWLAPVAPERLHEPCGSLLSLMGSLWYKVMPILLVLPPLGVPPYAA